MLLALDTSAAVSVAVCDLRAVVLAARHVYEPRNHAELLAPFIQECLAEAGATPADLRLVVAGQGPGPFTGLRVGLVTGRVMGLALGIPVHGVMSLDALAWQVAAGAGPGGAAEDLVVATDARRREVYWARYRVEDGQARRLEGPFVATAETVPASSGAAVGRGISLYPNAFAGTRVIVDDALLDPCAGALAAVAVKELGLSEVDADPTALPVRAPVPRYLRHPDATPPGATKPVHR